MTFARQAPTAYPTEGTKIRRVWDIADEISESEGRVAPREAVMRRFAAEGGNQNTASTQYSHWKKFRTMQQQPSANAEAGGPVRLTISGEGRLLIPAQLRAAMELDASGMVTAHLENGELRLVTPQVALRRLRRIVKEKVPEGVSLVDGLIAERRAESTRESDD